MEDTELSDRRANSMGWSEEVLVGAGFSRLRNTSVFQNAHGEYVLSPGVGPGRNGRYWFDLRERNIAKLPIPATNVLLRFVERGFAVVPLLEFKQHLNDRTRRLTSAGPAYGFNSYFADGVVTLRSSSDSTYSFMTKLLDRAGAADGLGQ